MAARTSTAKKRTTARRRKPVSRARVGKGLTVPRDVPIFARLGMRIALMAAKEMEAHKTVVMSRKDAAILRYTHEGCPTCKGNGVIYKKDKKTGAFTGSVACPAKPTHAKAGRVKVAMAARFGADRNTGLIGWTCPCGKKTKPRFRDAREATKDLRTHERKRHGGKTVGGAWYGQAIEGGADITENEAKVPGSRQKKAKASVGQVPYDPSDPTQEHRRGPVNLDPNVKNQHSGLTDKEWLAQGADRVLEAGECNLCQGTTYVAVINPNAESDYDRQVFRRCTTCVAGRVRS